MRAEYKWPGMMLFASLLNVGGAVGAIATGAHKNSDGGINPFFFTALATSILYSASHATKLYELHTSFAEKEKQRMATKLMEIV